MKCTLTNKLSGISKIIVALILVFSVVYTIPVTAYAATIYSHYMACEIDSEYYEANDPIDRVYEIKTGNSSSSRKITFEQIEGSISYYMYKNSTKSCKGSYEIMAFNEKTKKAKVYDWEWSNKKTITLDKNTNYTIIVYPADFDTVCQKYLTNKILNMRPIIYGYEESPYFTVSSSAPKFKYSGELATLTSND